MRTIEENFKYIVNLLDVNYDEIYSRYILITMVGSVEVQDIRFFTERGIPLLTYLAKINNVSVADYIKYMDARNKTTEPSFESVGNLQRAIELITLDFQTTKWFNMREIKNSTISGKCAMLYAVADLKHKTLKYMKNLIEKLKALRIYAVSKSFFCRHKWVDFKIRNFDEPKMDSKGRLATKMLIRECSKCGKMECFAMN